ncbi:hypothetical protein BDN71DRAFT_1500134, partial [Pleurotus eryngii]
VKTAVDTQAPTCVSGHQFDAAGAILKSLSGLKVNLAVDTHTKLDDFATDLSFNQANVPAIVSAVYTEEEALHDSKIRPTRVFFSTRGRANANETRRGDENESGGHVGHTGTRHNSCATSPSQAHWCRTPGIARTPGSLRHGARVGQTRGQTGTQKPGKTEGKWKRERDEGNGKRKTHNAKVERAKTRRTRTRERGNKARR